MIEYLFCDIQNPLRVRDMRRILEKLDDDTVICIHRLTEHFPAFIITKEEYHTYELGTVVGKEECILIR